MENEHERVFYLYGLPLDSEELSIEDLRTESLRLGILIEGRSRFSLQHKLLPLALEGAEFSHMRPDIAEAFLADNIGPPILPDIRILSLQEVAAMLMPALRAALTARNVVFPPRTLRQGLRDLLNTFETDRSIRLLHDRVNVGGEEGDVVDVDGANAAALMDIEDGRLDAGDRVDADVVARGGGGNGGGGIARRSVAAVKAAQEAFMGNLEYFDVGEGIALLEEQGLETWQHSYQQVGAGEYCFQKQIKDSKAGDTFVTLGGTNWDNSCIVAVYGFVEMMPDNFRFKKIYEVGVAPEHMMNVNIAFPKEGVFKSYMALNARGIYAVSTSMKKDGIPVPPMVAAENPNIATSQANNVMTTSQTGLDQQQQLPVVVVTTAERKEDRKKGLERDIVMLITDRSEMVIGWLESAVVNGIVNGADFQSRMMSCLASKQQATFDAAAFKSHLVSALSLGRFADSKVEQKSSDKQSVRLHDLVVKLDGSTGKGWAEVWEAFLSWRRVLGPAGTDFGITLDTQIQAWINVMRSGTSPANMPADFLELINYRRWFNLSILLQDSAVSEVSDEKAMEDLLNWAQWDRVALEQELTDWRRSKNLKDREEQTHAKKQRLDSNNNKGGRGGGKNGGTFTTNTNNGYAPGANISGGGGGTFQSRQGVGGRGNPGKRTTAMVNSNVSGSGLGVCLDNLGALMGVPGVSCARGLPSCKFDHNAVLVDLDRKSVVNDINFIMRDRNKAQSFLTTMATLKFKGE